MYIVPEKLKVGFQQEQAFIVPIRNGKQGSQISFDKWRDKKIPVVEIDNVSSSGFQITDVTKRSSDWFGSGRSVFKIRTPQGYLVEISSENLFEITQNCSIEKGLIKEKCVWAWQGVKKALIPIESKFYKEVIDNTNLLKLTDLDLKDLIPMTNYEVLTKGKKETLLYLGKYEFKANKIERIWPDRIEDSRLFFQGKSKEVIGEEVVKTTYMFAKDLEDGYIDLISILKPVIKSAVNLKPFKERKYFSNILNSISKSRKISSKVFEPTIFSFEFKYKSIKEIE